MNDHGNDMEGHARQNRPAENYIYLSPFPVIVLASDQSVVYANPAACSVFGQPEGDADERRSLACWARFLQSTGDNLSLQTGQSIRIPIGTSVRRYTCYCSEPLASGEMFITLTPEPIASVDPSGTFISAIEHLALGFMLVTPELIIRYMNRNILGNLDLTTEETTDTSLWEFIYPEDVVRFKRLLKNLIGGGIPWFQTELRLFSPTILPFWAQVGVTRFTMPESHEKLLLISVTDIDLLKTSEWRLKLENEFFRILLDAIPSPVFHRDKNGYFIGCNSAFERCFGVSRELLTWLNVADILPAEEAGLIGEIDSDLLREPGTRTVETTLTAAGQLVKDFLLSITTYYDIDPVLVGLIGQEDEDKLVEGFIGVAVDISERRKAEEELRESFESLKRAHDTIVELEKKNMALAMAATANHEINQPLMILKGNLDLLLASTPQLQASEKSSKYLTRIEQAMERIQGILNRYKNSEEFHMENYSEKTKLIIFEEDKSQD